MRLKKRLSKIVCAQVRAKARVDIGVLIIHLLIIIIRDRRRLFDYSG